MKKNIKILSVLMMLVLALLVVGCESEEAKEDADVLPSTELEAHEPGTGPKDGTGEGEKEGEHGLGQGEGYVDSEGNFYTAEELNARDKSDISIEDSMTLDEVASISMIKVWHYVADFNLPSNVDTSKTIAELNMEDDINLDVNELMDYVKTFEHGKGHHPEGVE